MADVQKAIFHALQPALGSVQVVDQAGANQAFPYCTIGEFIGEPADTLANHGADFELAIHIWSRALGMNECQTLMDTVVRTLHDQKLPFPGIDWVMVAMRFFQAQTLREIDGRTRHGIVRFRVMTFES